jgi:hypothetical protein
VCVESSSLKVAGIEQSVLDIARIHRENFFQFE